MSEDKKIMKVLTQSNVAEWISKGHTRKYCLDKLMEDGMSLSSAKVLYYGALKDLSPDPNLLDDYKRGIIQQNLDRLEQIVESSISGSTGEKMVALKAIDTLNKLVGAYEGNTVTVAQKDGEQIIQIRFGE